MAPESKKNIQNKGVKGGGGQISDSDECYEFVISSRPPRPPPPNSEMAVFSISMVENSPATVPCIQTNT